VNVTWLYQIATFKHIPRPMILLEYISMSAACAVQLTVPAEDQGTG
jgi:hypothetical protein